MKEPHQILGVSRTASQQEIKKAYHKKSLKAHPDKGGTEKEFNELKQAYNILSNIEEDESEDSGLWWNPYPTKFNHSKVHFTMLENPFSYNNYEYLEKAFDRDEFLDYDPNYFDKPIEQRMVSIYFMRDKIGHIMDRLQGEHRSFDVDNRVTTRWYVEQDTIEKNALFKDNLEKLGNSTWLLQKPPCERRALYDHSLGLKELEDNILIELVNNMGGLDSLKKMIAFKADIEFIPYLTSLNNARILTSHNIEQTINGIKAITTPWFSSFYEQKWGFKRSESDRDSYFRDLKSAINEMSRADVLNQHNFNLLIDNLLNIDTIGSAISSLIINGSSLDFQQHFLKCITLGSDACNYIDNKINLYNSSFYNDDILKVLGTDGLIKCSARPLWDIKKDYGESFEVAFQYQGGEATKSLEHAINQLFIHGLFIKPDNSLQSEVKQLAKEKKKLCICLAIELKKELYDFCQLDEIEKHDSASEFKAKFLKKLHLHDDKLSMHLNRYSQLIADILKEVNDFCKKFIPAKSIQISSFSIWQTPDMKHLQKVEVELVNTPDSKSEPNKPFYPCLPSFLYKT